MNIFKVFASAKNGFQEVYASSILAWLLNPSMDHGLGFAFISEFLSEISNNNNGALDEIVTELQLKLQTDDNLNWNCFLEYNVGNAFIDVLFEINHCIVSIENKVRSSSAGDKDQLSTQYKGLKERFPKHKIVIVFLVPWEGEVLPAMPQLEFDELKIDDPQMADFKTLITWQESIYPSIFNMIKSILQKESDFLIDPISEYTRHTLKSLNVFLANNFQGFPFERASSTSSGDNPLTEAKIKISDLVKKAEGYVGVKYGIAGLLRMPRSELKRNEFQYTRVDMSTKRNWISIQQFQSLVEWRLKDIVDTTFEWDVKLDAAVLFDIAGDFQENVFIGVKGGANALTEMDPEVIKKKRWGISHLQGTKEWIRGDIFHRILSQRQIFEKGIS